VKNLLLVDRRLTIVLLTDTYPGSVHDKRIADHHPYQLPSGSWLLQDLGFLAFALDGVECLTPFKKNKGGELTPAQKAFNHLLSTVRIRIEHVNSSVKRCRIVKDICRLRVVGVQDAVMEIACSLHNFRISLYPWPPLIK
jgi:DDE superfamily endonuclease